jgi:hypothetical protein
MGRFLCIAIAFAGLAFAAPKSWDNLGRLQAGAKIEVVTAHGSDRGAFASFSNEAIVVRTNRGERSFPRNEVLRVVSREKSRRVRNLLIGIGVGAAIGLVTDSTLGAYLRNESNPEGARALIWTLPIGFCGAIGAAIPSYPAVYRK